MRVRHHDLPSLMAGKIHSVKARPYVKGRDWYDLVWYCSKTPRVEPNHALLQAALDQTEGSGSYEAQRWREMLLALLDELDTKTIRDDVLPFLERSSDADLKSEG